MFLFFLKKKISIEVFFFSIFNFWLCFYDYYFRTTWVTIQGLPATCDDSSIRISKKTGTGTILEVFVENSTRELLKEDDKTEEDQEITDPEEKKKAIEKRNEKKKQIIEELVARQLELSQELERLIQKKDWMEGYASQQTHTESGINLSIDEAVEFLQFYNEQNQNFDQRKDEITEELTEIERKRASLVVFKKVKSVHLLLSKAEGGHLFSLSYVVNNAQWKPVYDLRVRTKDAQDDTIDLSYFGVITNSSGDHWENVSLSLSTAQPHVAGFSFFFLFSFFLFSFFFFFSFFLFFFFLFFENQERKKVMIINYIILY